MGTYALRWVQAAVVGCVAGLALAQNVALNKPVTVVAGGASGAAPATLTDGVFRPRGTGYQDGTVWWNGLTTTFEIDLQGVFAIAGLIVQADDNDPYTVQYRRTSDNTWQVAWNVPNYDAQGDGMQTRPDPANHGTAFALPATIETDRLRIVAASGDNAYSLSEVQAIAAPSTQCAAEWRFAQVGGRTNVAAAYDSVRGRALLFGGYSSDNARALGDTWVRFPGADVWTNQDVLGPEARSRHAVAFDPVRQRLVMFGGLAGQTFLGDTWEWDGAVWLPQTGSVAPAPRYGHAMAFDPVRQQVVLFGGQGTTGRLGDTWTWDGSAWTRVVLTGPSPAARTDGAMAYAVFADRVVLVGGNTGTTSNADVWHWNGSVWSQQATPAWTPRSGHAMTYDAARGRVVLFGGTSGSAVLNDVWEWGGAAWVSLAASGPDARSGHAMYYDIASARTVVFGGSGSRYFGDTWEWSGTVWTSRTETTPSARSQAAMVEHAANNRLLLFGGLTPQGDSNQTWEWDGSRWQFRNVTGPNARYGHAMAYDVDRGKAVLFGGYVFGGISQDTHEWDGSAWVARSNLPGTLPPRRAGHAMVYDAANHRTVLFGGSGVSLPADTWSFDGTQWLILVPAGTGRPTIRNMPAMAYDSIRGRIVMFGGSGSGQTRFDDTWVLEGATWRSIAIPAANRPPARGAAAFAFDAVRGTAVLTGGSGSAASLTDTWEWNGQSEIWSRVQISSPGARAASAMAYDAARRRMTLFGGSIGPNQYAGDTWARNSSSLDAPTFTSQPSNLAAASNEPAELSAAAENALSYRWRRNGVYLTDGPSPGGGAFSGTATPILRLSVVDLLDAGTYDVVAINTCGATLSAAATLSVTSGPDLVVSSVQVEPPEGLNGDPVTIRWTVTNMGDRAAPAGFVDRVFVTPVSPAGSESTVSGFVSAPRALGPGEFYTQSFSAAFPNPAGSLATYRYTVRTDVRVPQNVHETREDNNSASSADVPVVVPPPGDLTPGDLTAPDTVLFGSAFTTTWNELNQGGIIRRTWNSRVVLSQNQVFGDADDRVLGTPLSSTARLPGGNAAPFSVNATIPYDGFATEGTHYLIVKSDFVSNNPNGVIAESNEANNVAMRQVDMRFPQRADLVVTESVAPLEGLTEQSFQISWTVRNDGNAAATGWNDRAYLSTNATYEVGDPPLGPDLPAPRSLAPGESYQRTQQYNFPATPNTHYLIIRTDTGSSVPESPMGEQNNTRVHATPILVRQFPKPDLQITSVTPVSSGVISGQTITIRFQVSNLGTGPTTSPSWRDAIFLLSPEQQFGTTCLTGFTFLGESSNPSYLPAPGNNDNRYEQIVQVALPHDITGTYKIGIATDARRRGCPGWSVGQPGDVSELIENNNAAYSPTFTIELEPQPDMQVQSIAIDGPSIAFSGQNIAILRSIINRDGDPPRGGATDVGTWTDRLYLSTHNRPEPPSTGAGDIILADVGGGSGVLQPGQAFSARTTHRLPTNISGLYFIKCQTDLTGRISEFGFESNNLGVSTAPVDIRLTPPPDLEPTAASFSGPLVVIPQQVVSFSWSVENFGAPPQTDVSWSDGAYLSADATLNTGIDPLMTRPGASSERDAQNQPIINAYSRNGEYRLPGTLAAGDYRLIVRTDDQGAIFEGTDGEANNIRVSSNTIRVEARYADLLAALDGVPTPSGHAGARGLIGWRVSNVGVVSTQVGNWVDRVWFNTAPAVGGTVLSTQSRNGALAVGSAYTGSVEYSVPLVGPGQYYVVVATDADNAVAEGPGEGNNIVVVPFTVTAEAADLVAVALTAPATGNADQSITVGWTVENRGVLPTNANSWIDRIYLSRNPNLTGAVEIGARTRTQPLAAADSYSDQGNFTLPRESSGVYYILFRTDTNGSVFESNEANNTGPQSPPAISVTPIDVNPPSYPNLEAISVTAPSEATENQPMAVTWSVSNTGLTAISANRTWRDSFYLSRDQFFDPPQSGGLGDIYIGSSNRRGPVAGSGGTYEATASLTLPAGVAGPYFVIVRTDAGGEIDEGGREADNTANATNLTIISIAPLSDLTVASVTPPASAELGAAAPFAWSIRNSGQSTIRATWQDSLFLSTDPVWSIDDRRIGNFQNNPSGGAIAPDEAAPGTATPRIPGVTPGEYYVVARADVLNQVPETDEAHNTAASISTLVLEATLLQLGVSRQEPLSAGEERYFRFSGVEGRTIRVRAAHNQPGAWLELYLRRSEVPTQGQFDFAHEVPARSVQDVIIPRGGTGDYYVLVRASAGATAVGLVDVLVDEIPFSVARVSPEVGGNAGTITLAVLGAQFDELTTVRLLDPRDGREVAPLWHRRESASRLLATFSLVGETPGPRDVILRSEQVEWRVTPEGHIVDELVVYGEDRARDVFEVVQGGGPQVRVSSQLPPSARQGAVFPVVVTVENVGLNDAAAPIVQIGSPNGAPLSFSPSAPSASGSQLQVLALGTSRADVLGPGEAVIITVYCRAITLPASRIFVQELESTSQPVNWVELERYYRDTSPGPQWSQTWTAFRAKVGETWADLHTALRSRAALRWSGVERSFNANELMLDLFAVARAESMNIRLGHRPPTQRYGPRVDCDSYVPSGCDQFACDVPIVCGIYLATMEMEARLRSVALAGRFGFDFASVVYDYLGTDCRNQHPGRFFGPGSTPSDGLAETEETRMAVQMLLYRAASQLMQGGDCDDLPCDVPISRSIHSLFPSGESENLQISWCPSCTAGGALVGGQSGSVFGPDLRRAVGDVIFVKKCDPCTGKPRSLEVIPAFYIEVIDAFDFCPGGLGDSDVARFFTVPLALLERNDYAFPVPLTVHIATNPDHAVTVSGTSIGRNCDEPLCPLNPPSNPCAAVCEEECGQTNQSGGGSDCCDSCGGDVPTQQAIDPNEKAGPSGFGVERWIPNATVPYRIYFENLPTATAPASIVTVTDDLSTDLIPGSFRLGRIQIADRTIEIPANRISYSTTVDLRATRGVLLEIVAGVDTSVTPPRAFWTLQSIDPSTGLPPVTGDLGFLPPNDETGRGEGYVEFTIRPRTSVATGTIITNDASIVFDNNEPIRTNVVSNTIDSEAPVSMAAELPAASEPGEIAVSIAAGDLPGGSGLAGSRLFVSRDGGAYQPITSLSFDQQIVATLEPGHVYRFSTQATDNAGNIEALPGAPDAMTTTLAIALAPASDSGIAGDSLTNDRTPSLAVVGPPNSTVQVRVSGPDEVEGSALCGGDGRGIFTVPDAAALRDGQYTVTVTSGEVQSEATIVVDGTPPVIRHWQSMAVHGTVGDVLLSILGDSTVEPRLTGIARLRYVYAGNSPDPVIPTPDSVQLTGFDAAGQPINLSGIQIATSPNLTVGGVDILFTPALPDSGRYCIRVDGVRDAAGNPLSGNNRISLTALAADATGDLRTNNTDVGGIQSLIGTNPIDPTNDRHVRSDINTDGVIDAADRLAALALRGTDLRFVPSPCPGGRSDGGGPLADTSPPPLDPDAPPPGIREQPPVRVLRASITALPGTGGIPPRVKAATAAGQKSADPPASPDALVNLAPITILATDADGLAAGYHTPEAGAPAAALWSADTGLIDLNDLLSPDDGWRLLRADGFQATDAPGTRVITGEGTLGGVTTRFGLVIMLIEEAGGDLDGNGTVDEADLTLLLTFKESGDPCCDVNGDGIINIADVEALISLIANR